MTSTLLQHVTCNPQHTHAKTGGGRGIKLVTWLKLYGDETPQTKLTTICRKYVPRRVHDTKLKLVTFQCLYTHVNFGMPSELRLRMFELHEINGKLRKIMILEELNVSWGSIISN